MKKEKPPSVEWTKVESANQEKPPSVEWDDGSRGHLETLATRYAEELRTHYRDVLARLEEIRKRRVAVDFPPLPPQGDNLSLNPTKTFKPGKYSPSSCLSDHEEESIYSLYEGAGPAAALLPAAPTPSAATATRRPQPRCLSPRSRYFYEPCPFPAGDLRENTEPSNEQTKKRGPLGRLFRSLGPRKDREKISPRHKCAKPQQQQQLNVKYLAEGSRLQIGDMTTTPGTDDEQVRLLLQLVRDGFLSMEDAMQRIQPKEAEKSKSGKSHEKIEVLADLGRSVWSPTGGKKNHQKNTALHYKGTTLPGRHIYYEPPDDFDFDHDPLVPSIKTTAGEVTVHCRDTCTTCTAPNPLLGTCRAEFPFSSRVGSTPGNGPLQSEVEPAAKAGGRAYTQEEFTSAILARTHGGSTAAQIDRKASQSPLPRLASPHRCPSASSREINFCTESCASCYVGGCDSVASCSAANVIVRSQSCTECTLCATTPVPDIHSTTASITTCAQTQMGDGGDCSATTCRSGCIKEKGCGNGTQSVEECHSVSESVGMIPDYNCERSPNPRHSLESKADSRGSDYATSPVLERRNKGVFGRLRNLASRTSYSTSEDGHSHSSDYEEQEEDKKIDARFTRDSSARSSSSWAGRVRDLHRDVKRKISRLRNSRGATPDDDPREGAENQDGMIQPGSSVESIPSGSGSSLQPPTPTSSNRSSTSAGEDDNSPYVGVILSRARALVDYTPSPYDRDGLAFKKGDTIDIIAKHKTGIWVGMVNGKVGHFKFINVEEILSESKPRHRRRKAPPDWLSTASKPETLEDLLKQLGLQEYMNVLVLNGYDELETFKEIEKDDLDSLGIINPEHCIKLLRAAEMLQGVDLDEDDDDDAELKQSPRDSGCYASHENLTHRETSQRLLHNGQLPADGEDQDTSHSESGIHSREGQDLSATMNNLDLSAESSTKSTATTMDSREDVAISGEVADCQDDRDPANYNIPPSHGFLEDQEESRMGDSDANFSSFQDSLRDEGSTNAQTVSVHLMSQTLPLTSSEISERRSSGSRRSHQSSSLTNGLKEPSRRNKTKKSSRDKYSSSHRSKHEGTHNDLYTPETFRFTRYREDIADPYTDRSSYLYGWASFSRKERTTRRRIQEYDDVVSDPATEPEESPGRHVYMKAKQRKGSLQALIHNPRPPSPTLLGVVKHKLDTEKIDLCEEPYTDKTGFCGIPPALVQRYAEELQKSVGDVADALDQVRITLLQQQGRRGVPNDFLADSCTVPVIEANYSCLHSWLVSLGLPMYEDCFVASGFSHLHNVATLNGADLGDFGIEDPFHRCYLEAATGALFSRFGRRASISPPPLPHPPSSSSS